MNIKAINDVIINIIASSVYSITLNLIIYPVYARRFSSEDFGNILTFIGIISLLWSVIGNCFNNTRLILNKRLRYKNSEGNYNYIILVASFFGGVIVTIATIFLGIQSYITIILIFIAVIFGIARAYYIVSFRLKLDYFSQLKTNIIVSIGYISGTILCTTITWWPIPFCLGEICAFFYSIKKGGLFKEPFKFTKNCKIILNTYFNLIISSVLVNIIIYFDRFLINPLLGPSSVAIFSVAVFYGKILSPLLSPIANVMLSYLCHENATLDLKRLLILILSSIFPLISFGIIGIWIAPSITGLFFPTLIQSALPYIIVASSGCLIQYFGNLLMPILLTIYSARIVVIINLIYLLSYAIISISGIYYNGLKGFCISVCIVGIIRAITLIVFCFVYIKRKVI